MNKLLDAKLEEMEERMRIDFDKKLEEKMDNMCDVVRDQVMMEVNGK